MKKTILLVGLPCLLISLLFSVSKADPPTEETFITIGGGDLSGIYFPAGLAISKMVNAKRHVHGIRSAVEATSGAVFNLKAIMAGYLEFGLTQSDKQYQAYKGLAEWAQQGPQSKLRTVFSLHHETLTLIAAQDADIHALADLKGKKVSLGNPNSGQHRLVKDALNAVGLDPGKDLLPITVMASEAPALLQDRRIDAYFFIVGHPSQTIKNALYGQRKARIIPISGPGIDKLVSENEFYLKTTIPVEKLYPEIEGHEPVDTFGVIATLCTSAHVPDAVVYAVTKEIFENLELLRQQHQAFYNLSSRGMLEGLAAPIHPGAIRYYKETGLLP